MLLSVSACYAWQQDYSLYHQGIIKAEKELFIDKDHKKGLTTFQKTFDSFEFAFVDDCIEAFQLALVYEDDAHAMAFIKKALDNGFELRLLSRLTYKCVCDYYASATRIDFCPVAIWQPFMAKHAGELAVYQKAVYPKYLVRINKPVLENILRRHVREQLYKNYVPALGMSQKDQRKAYIDISNDNMRYIDSLNTAGVYLGERLLGIYTDTLVKYLKLHTVEDYKKIVLNYHGVPVSTYVPIQTEADYFYGSPLYILLYHNKRSYEFISRYLDEAVSAGYIHPREYAHLTPKNDAPQSPRSEMYLSPGAEVTDPAAVNRLRAKAIIPSIEIDNAKHKFAHQYKLHLFFGFLYASR